MAIFGGSFKDNFSELLTLPAVDWKMVFLASLSDIRSVQ